MSLKQLVKKYPVTIIFTIFISLSIITLFIQSKVYAASTQITEGCYIEEIKCSSENAPNTDSLYCTDRNVALCTCTYPKAFTICSKPTMPKCMGEKDAGCGCGKIACTQSDCGLSPDKNCGNCQKWELQKPDCKGPVAASECDECNYKITEIKDYVPA